MSTVHIIYPVACQYTVHIHSLYQSFLQLLLIHSSYHLYSCLSIHSSYPQFIQFISVICPVVCQYTVHIHSSYQSFIQLLVSTQFISTVHISHLSSCLSVHSSYPQLISVISPVAYNTQFISTLHISHLSSSVCIMHILLTRQILFVSAWLCWLNI